MVNICNHISIIMTTLIEYLNYPFFLRALVVGLSLSLLLSWMSGYIVLRREVLFADSLSNIGFLGIALAILFNLPITPTLIVACLFAAFLITYIQRKKLFASDSLLEIFAQLGLSLAIIVIALFPGYRVNIEQFLFGDILGINQTDVIISLSLLAVTGILIFLYHKTFLKISLSDQLSHSIVKNKKFWHSLLIFLLALLVALAMKIIGVLLVAAFITIPSNAAKLFANSLKQTFILSTLVGLISTIFGLFLSVSLNLPSGALIVACLGGFWVISIFYHKLFHR